MAQRTRKGYGRLFSSDLVRLVQLGRVDGVLDEGLKDWGQGVDRLGIAVDEKGVLDLTTPAHPAWARDT